MGLNFKKILISLFLICGCVSLYGQQKEYDFSIRIGQFDRLNIVDDINVIYHCNPDSTGYAYWRAATDLRDCFIFNENKGKLTVQVSTDKCGRKDLPTLHLYSDFLTSVTSSSIGTVRIESLAATSSFKATLIGNGNLVVHGIRCTRLQGELSTGNGQLVLSGEADQAEYKIIGTGTIQADMIKAETVKCGILGSGSIGCWPIKLLKVSGIGSTKIYYRGSPDVRKTGGGKLFRIPTEETSVKDRSGDNADIKS